jgi:DNA repair ATPase RecN
MHFTEMSKIINISDFTKPDIFEEKLQTLTHKLPGIIEEYKRAYLFHNKNPQNNEYQQIYESVKNNMITFNSEVFALSNDIDENIDKLNKVLHKLNVLIEDEKENNQKIKEKISNLENTEAASNELIHDYKQIYSLNYTKNWGLYVSIFICGLVSYNVYRKKI